MAERRLWTEEELTIAYWALPVMRALSHATHREFAAIAMKMANLLAVETDMREGLPNVSLLDRAIVEKFGSRRDELEERVLHIVEAGQPSSDRHAEIREEAIDVLRTHRVPLHVETIALLLRARNPLLVATPATVRSALNQILTVQSLETDVFEFIGNKSAIQ